MIFLETNVEYYYTIRTMIDHVVLRTGLLSSYLAVSMEYSSHQRQWPLLQRMLRYWHLLDCLLRKQIAEDMLSARSSHLEENLICVWSNLLREWKGWYCFPGDFEAPAAQGMYMLVWVRIPNFATRLNWLGYFWDEIGMSSFYRSNQCVAGE